MTNDAAIYDKLFYNLNTTGPVLSPLTAICFCAVSRHLLSAWNVLPQNAQEVVAFSEAISCGKRGSLSRKGWYDFL